MADSTEKLFLDFPPVSTAQWKEKVTTDLKGADFDKRLVWRTNEGFSVQPMYRAEDLAGINATASLPGEYPYVRGTKNDNEWLVRQEIEVCGECLQGAHSKAVSLLDKGITSIGFILDRDVVSASTLETLLEGIDLSTVEVNFKTCAKASVELTHLFVAYVASKGYAAHTVVGSINFDPMGRFVARGKSLDRMFEQYAEIIKASLSLPFFKVVGVNPIYFNNAGAYIYQELGLALAWGNDLLSKLQDQGLTVDTIAKKIKFNFGVGANYFMEIAKFRAARYLWANIVLAYEPKCQRDCKNNAPDGLCRCAAKMRIHAETSTWNMTTFDAHVNMLRTQTEAMSAVLAGVDSLTVLPFNVTFQDADDFSERIARNQQLLLKEESHFNKVVDPSSGSYYIESLTESIAEQAWKLFLEIESKGGFWSQVQEGNIQAMINTSGASRRAAVAARKESLLGTNQFPNFNETATSKIVNQACGTCCSHKEEGTLNFSRGASDFESLRLETEAATKRPVVFMLTIGSLAMRLARAQFACNFFACAGYEVIDNLGFSTAEEGVESALTRGADVVVICSSDDEYSELAPAAFKALGGRAEFVVAGAPACADDLKAMGINQFINVRSNVLDTLKAFNSKLLK